MSGQYQTFWSHLHCKEVIAPQIVRVCRTHSQFSLSLVHSPFCLQAKNPPPEEIYSTAIPSHNTSKQPLQPLGECTFYFYYAVLYSPLNFLILNKTQGCTFYDQKKKKI